MNGTEDRKDRALNPKDGSWGSSSQDLVRLSFLLFLKSKEYAENNGGNFSVYALAGIPALFSALRALLLEAQAGMYGDGRHEDNLRLLVGEKGKRGKNEWQFICDTYDVDEQLIKNLQFAYEIRNEISHPSHMPSGTSSGTPEYLTLLREKELLEKGIWISQLQSHKLFYWVAEIVESVVAVILNNHHKNKKEMQAHLISWSRFKNAEL